MYAEAETNPQVDILWHTVPFGHRDVYPLNILAQILSTRTGRLYKGLVLGKQVATEVQAGPDTRKALFPAFIDQANTLAPAPKKKDFDDINGEAGAG